MSQKITGLAGKIAFGLAAGVGFNLCQRLLDHFIDMAVIGSPTFAWLAS